MKKYMLILALLSSIGIANAAEPKSLSDIPFSPIQPLGKENNMATQNDLVADLASKPVNEVLLDEMLNKGKSLEFSMVEMIDAAPDKAGDIVAAATEIAPDRAARLTQLAVLRAPTKVAAIVAAAIKAAPGHKPQIVGAAHQASGLAVTHPGVRWYFPFIK